MTIKSLKSSGWVDAPTEAPRRAIVSIEGQDKTGKTHLALTAERPIAYIDIDVGTEGVVERFQARSKEGQILLWQVPVVDRTGDPRELIQRFSPVFEEVLSKYYEALENDEIKTVIVDTFTELYDLGRLAVFGKTNQILPQEYGPRLYSPYMRPAIRSAYKTTKNVIFLHRLENDFNNPNKLVMKGFKEVPYLVQAHIRLYREDSENGTGPTFSGEFLNCRQNHKLMGRSIPQLALDFGMILSLIHDQG